MSGQYTAVIDIGKTNKKVLIFDERLKLVESAYRSFEEYIENGIRYEATEKAGLWFKEQIGIFAKKYTIGAISITTHGATAIGIDKNGAIAVPPVAYTTDAGDAFDDEFYSTIGSRDELQKETSTAQIGSLINLAKLIYFVKKHWPDKFKTVWKYLNYPQYFGYLFTGKIGADPTYTGCHTYLFDFDKKTYSTVAEKLGITDLLPEKISRSWEILGTVSESVSRETGLSTDCIVTMGIHDSNSSLLPYLVKGYKNFVLNSTGTWCVAMHPSKAVSFKPQEIGKLVFFNLDAFFNPVKTSIFMGGLELETYRTLFTDITGRSDFPTFDHNRYTKILAEKKLFILPSVVRGTGLFPTARPKVIEDGKEFLLEDIRAKKAIPSFFSDFDTACAVLNISLALQTMTALDMAGFKGEGDIFTEGGFRKNDAYNILLSALFPQSRATTTNLSEATAFGAALLARAALDNTTPMETASLFDIETNPVVRQALPDIDTYATEFFKQVG
jgi:sugar (pentulose or hexulose) kinase